MLIQCLTCHVLFAALKSDRRPICLYSRRVLFSRNESTCISSATWMCLEAFIFNGRWVTGQTEGRLNPCLLWNGNDTLHRKNIHTQNTGLFSLSKHESICQDTGDKYQPKVWQKHFCPFKPLKASANGYLYWHMCVCVSVLHTQTHTEYLDIIFPKCSGDLPRFWISMERFPLFCIKKMLGQTRG